MSDAPTDNECTCEYEMGIGGLEWRDPWCVVHGNPERMACVLLGIERADTDE